MGVSAATLAFVLLSVFASGVLRGFTGFGFALAATPLLSLSLAPRVVVPVVLILQVGSSLVGLRGTIAAFDRRSTAVLGACAVLATPGGVLLLRVMDADTARLVIALVTASAAVLLAVGWRHRGGESVLAMLPFGLAAGLFGGACAMPGPPILAYYLGRATEPATARASMILIFLATGCVALATSASIGLARGDALLLALAASPAMVLGTTIGTAWFRRAAPSVHRPVGIASLAVIAAMALVRAVR